MQATCTICEYWARRSTSTACETTSMGKHTYRKVGNTRVHRYGIRSCDTTVPDCHRGKMRPCGTAALGSRTWKENRRRKESQQCFSGSDCGSDGLHSAGFGAAKSQIDYQTTFCVNTPRRTTSTSTFVVSLGMV